jgi:6-phosphogluconolactonase
MIKDDSASLAVAAADIFALTAKECVAERGRFVVAVSGGSTPRAAHRLLTEEPYRSGIQWEKVHIFWVDERCVPEDHPASNYGAARKDFLDRVTVPAEQIHPMTGDAVPEETALTYQRELEAFFGLGEGEPPVFDLICLGIGKDGHTASLFPAQRALDEKQRWVVAVKGGDPNVSRLTMTYPILNRASQIVFVAFGREKAAIVKSVVEMGEEKLPAQRIRPVNGRLTWLLDREAASLLTP